MALGAQSGAVQRMVVGQAAWLVAAGIGIGTVLTVLGGRTASTMLFGVQPTDPVAFAVAVVGLFDGRARGELAAGTARLPVPPTVALREE